MIFLLCIGFVLLVGVMFLLLVGAIFLLVRKTTEPRPRVIADGLRVVLAPTTNGHTHA